MKKLVAAFAVVGLLLAGSAWAAVASALVTSDTLALNASKTSVAFDVSNCARFWLNIIKISPFRGDTSGLGAYNATKTVIAVRAVEVMNRYVATDAYDASVATGISLYSGDTDSTEVAWMPIDTVGVSFVVPTAVIASSNEMVKVIPPKVGLSDKMSARFDFINQTGAPMRAQFVRFRWRVLSGPSTCRFRVVLGKENY